MSAVLETSIRTQVRDVFMAALTQLQGNDEARIKDPDIVTDYLHETEIKKSASYGVIVTDESLEQHSQGSVDVTLIVLVIVYVRSESDRRALLDSAIEDIWRVLGSGQMLKPVVPYVRLESVTTNENSTDSKPYAQAQMRWNARVRRPVSW